MCVCLLHSYAWTPFFSSSFFWWHFPSDEHYVGRVGALQISIIIIIKISVSFWSSARFPPCALMSVMCNILVFAIAIIIIVNTCTHFITVNSRILVLRWPCLHTCIPWWTLLHVTHGQQGLLRPESSPVSLCLSPSPRPDITVMVGRQMPS